MCDKKLKSTEMISANCEELREKKKKLREEVFSNIFNLTEEYKKEADKHIVNHLLQLNEYEKANTVFCFVGVDHEINTRPFLERALADGKRLTVPLCVEKGIMEAREIYSLDDLTKGYYGLYEPSIDTESIPLNEVDLAVVPCLTADHFGNRLGHGGGYYDRLFNKYPDVFGAIICREKIMKADIPLGPFDRQFPMVITEKGVFKK